MRNDSDIERLRWASGAVLVVAGGMCAGLLFRGEYLNAAVCAVVAVANGVGLATLGVHQKTREIYRDIRRGLYK